MPTNTNETGYKYTQLALFGQGQTAKFRISGNLLHARIQVGAGNLQGSFRPSSAQDGSQTPAIGVANVYPCQGSLPRDTYRDQDAAVEAGNAAVGGLNFGSSARTRTWNLVVTSAPKFLLGLDYLFTRFRILKGGCRALPLRQPQSTSIGSSLCTFPDRFCSTRAWLRVTVSRFPREAGFPEFTRFFNHDFSWKLRLHSHPLCQLSYRGAGGNNLS